MKARIIKMDVKKDLAREEKARAIEDFKIYMRERNKKKKPKS